MNDAGFPYYVLLPLAVFGPLFVWMLYTFGLRDLIRMPDEMKKLRLREQKADEARATLNLRKRGAPGQFRTPEGPASPLGWVGQAVAYLAFAAVLGVYSNWPDYRPLEPGQALVKLSLSHPGKRRVECRRRGAEELARLAPNMRNAVSCPRGRWPVTLELVMDGKRIFKGSAGPAGVFSDGASNFYETFPVPAGRHQLVVRMGDGGKGGKYDYVYEGMVTLSPARVLVVGFDARRKSLYLK